MPTTTFTDATFSVAAIGNRTDSAGASVADYTAEEARFVASILNGGYIKPTSAFQVTQQASPNMTVLVGSGTAKADYYVVPGTVGGQGNYIVRLDATSITVTVPAADASQTRTDQVYLVVRDNAYDASARALPQIGYRQGDLGGATPGPDSAWDAYALLATISVPALDTAIQTAQITDGRVAATLIDGVGVNTSTLVLKSLVDAKGDLIVGTANDAVARLPVGTNGYVLTADSAQAAGVKWGAPSAPVAGSNAVSGTFETPPASYGDMATVGPIVTITVGASGIAIIQASALIRVNTDSGSNIGYISFALTGANTLAAGTANEAQLIADTMAAGTSSRVNATISLARVLTGLTPGSTTFTLKYQKLGTATINNRQLSVVTF